jgi:uncharacterized protein YjbK
MKIEKEIEFKTLLTENEYNTLLELFTKNTTSYNQTNFYFDNDNFELNAKKITCRVREKNNNFELTVKIKDTVGLNEYNQEISYEEFINYKNNGLNLNYDVITANNLKIKAQNTTTRFDLRLHNQLFSLDKINIDNNIHYELEMETENYDEGLIIFNNFLKEYNIEYKKGPSKAKRTFEYYKKNLS